MPWKLFENTPDTELIKAKSILYQFPVYTILNISPFPFFGGERNASHTNILNTRARHNRNLVYIAWWVWVEDIYYQNIPVVEETIIHKTRDGNPRNTVRGVEYAEYISAEWNSPLNECPDNNI